MLRPKEVSDLSFALLRAGVGGLLLWGAATKLLNPQRMEALSAAWASAGVYQAELAVAVSIGAQLLLALLLLIGLFTRLAGFANGLNFAIAAAISGAFAASADWWAFALLIVLLLHFGIRGAGSFSLDGLLRRRAAAGPRAASIEELLGSVGIAPQSRDHNYPGGR